MCLVYETSNGNSVFVGIVLQGAEHGGSVDMGILDFRTLGRVCVGLERC